MVGFSEVVSFVFENPELGWIVVLVYLAYELRGERGRIYKLDKKITSAIVVIRALSRKGAEGVDEEIVDEYLVENGMEPGDFIKEDGERAPTRANVADGSFAGRSDGEGQFNLDEVIAEEKEKSAGQGDNQRKEGT
jgi:hypothetical protein